MADIRPKDLLPTAAIPAADDYLLLDGPAQGTRKLLAANIMTGSSIKAYGAKGDGKPGYDGVATSGNATFTSADSNWTDGDVGKVISLKNPATNVSYNTTIASVNPPGQSLVLSVAPPWSGTSVHFIFGTDDTDAFDAAFAADDPDIYLPKGIYVITRTLVIPSGRTLRGVSSGYMPFVAGTAIWATASITGNIIESPHQSGTQFFHWSRISDLQIIGYFQTGGVAANQCSGINFYRSAENTLVDRVQVEGCAGNGISLRDAATPLKVGYNSLSVNGHRAIDKGYGLFLDNSQYTHNDIDYISGDNNKTALIGIKNLWRSTVFIKGFKAERMIYEGNSNPDGHPYVIDIENGYDGCVMIGSGYVWQFNTSSPGTAIIRNTADVPNNEANIVVLGAIANNNTAGAEYTSFYVDTNNNTIPLANYNGRTGPYAIKANKPEGEITTTANIENIAHHVNTIGKYTGKQLFNTTTNRPLWAAGSGTTSAWVDGTGATAHLPS